MARIRMLAAKPWIWSFAGALLVWLTTISFTGGYGAGGMVTAALSLAVFMVIVGVGQMFVITLGPGNVDLSLPANIGLASAVKQSSHLGAIAVAPGEVFRELSTSCCGLRNPLPIPAFGLPSFHCKVDGPA